MFFTESFFFKILLKIQFVLIPFFCPFFFCFYTDMRDSERTLGCCSIVRRHYKVSWNIGKQQTHLCPTYTRRLLEVKHSIGGCKKLTLMMPFTVMRKLFFTPIYPLLTYGIDTWGHSSVTQLNRLDSKLKKSVQIFGK